MKKVFDVQKLIARAVLALLLTEISLNLSGCCLIQIGNTEHSQCELSKPESVNIQPAIDNFKTCPFDLLPRLASADAGACKPRTGSEQSRRIGDSQGSLHLAAGYKNIDNKNGNRDIIAAIEQEQAMLRYLVQQNNQQMFSLVTCIPQDNLYWQGGIGNLHIYTEQTDKGTFCRKN
jgi:hypothetical protein